MVPLTAPHFHLVIFRFNFQNSSSRISSIRTTIVKHLQTSYLTLSFARVSPKSQHQWTRRFPRLPLRLPSSTCTSRDMCERWRPHPRSAPVLAARAAVARSNACGAVCSLSLAAAARLGPQARPSAGALALAGGVPLFPPTSPLFHRPRDVVRSMHFIIELAKMTTSCLRALLHSPHMTPQ